jgi:hypothetical protein
MTLLIHRSQVTLHGKVARRTRPFPRHNPSPAVAARTTRHCRRIQSTQTHAQEPVQQQEPLLPEDIDLNDPELQAQITALLKELDPDLLLVGMRAQRAERPYEQSCVA